MASTTNPLAGPARAAGAGTAGTAAHAPHLDAPHAPHAPPPPPAPRDNRPAPLGLRPPRNTLLTPPATPLHRLDGAGADDGNMAAGGTTKRGGKNTGLLDLFFLTLNCAKAPVDVDVFARHLRAALRENGARARRSGQARGDGEEVSVEAEETLLPDLVVFSLQEIAPLTYGYLGGQFLAPYLNPFREALNLAALELEQSPQPDNPRATLQRSKSALSTLFRRRPDYPYKLIEARNVGMTAIMLFARKPDAIHHIQHAECAFGIANMGNKGAIALRVMYAADGDVDDVANVDGASSSQERRVAEVTFVATHLAAMEYNLRRRNANWASICSSCLFEDPTKTIPKEYHLTEPGAKNVIEASTHSSSTASNAKQTDGGEDIPPESEEEQQALIARQLNDASMPEEYLRHLHDISIFKPGSHLFVGGDLNYRISTTTPHAMDTFPTLETYPDFFERDQLTQERLAGRALRGLSEAPVTFPPTYKIKHLSREKADGATNKEEFEAALAEGRVDEVVPWKWASHRWPGWCDRILFLDIPKWVKRRYTDNNHKSGGGSSKPAPEIKIHAYSSLPTMITSDHQPVFLRASVPLLPPGELLRTEAPVPAPAPSPGGLGEDREDPRCQLPIPIDTGAFARREAARRREVITGMTALFFSTKEGAIVVAAIAAVGLSTWWLYQGFF